jgi:hypothetical protein
MNIYGCFHKLIHFRQMRFTKELFELLEQVEHIGKFILYVILLLTALSIGVIIFIWWGIKIKLF